MSEAVVGSPPVEGVRFVKEEPVELKGVAQPVEVFLAHRQP